MPKILDTSKMTAKKGFFSNPFVMLVIAIIVLILLLAIFRSVSPALTLGFDIRAHIGDLRGSIALEAYQNSNSPAFVLFYSPTCPHCTLPHAGFQQLQQEAIPGVAIQTIDCVANPELAQENGIRGFPTMRFYPNGLNVKDYDEYEGGRSVEELRSYVKNLV
jgi:thiol-disulfide isomerase/thioredoxin